MKSMTAILILALLPVSLFGQGAQFVFLNYDQPLMDHCGGGAPLPDGTIVEVLHDPTFNGLDPTDTLFVSFPINGESIGVPGGFQSPQFVVDTLQSPLHLLLRCCIPGTEWAWVSMTVIISFGNNEFIVSGMLDCIDDGWTGCEFIPTEDIRVDLIWFNEQAIDLDLWVTDPFGERCYYGNPITASGGELLRDNLCANYINGRPETIIWMTAPPGEYAVAVDWWSDCGNNIDSQPFTVRYAIRGEWETVTGTIHPDESLEDITFTFDTTEAAPNPFDEIYPDAYHLNQNYPNPFNPVTTIRFGLPREENVTLNVFDVTGRLITTLAEGRYPADEHSVTFDGSNLPSGIYFYHLEAGEFFDTRKMILLK